MTASADPVPAVPSVRVVKVSRATIEAARARVNISKMLGRPVSKVVEKIAAIP
jgi:hypothetical protein